MLTDFLLIQKMKQGNEQAFNTFVRKYYNEILKYCSYHCYDTEYAEDLTQETFVKVWLSLKTYNQENRLSTWLYKITCNTCYDRLRSLRHSPLDNLSLIHI